LRDLCIGQGSLFKTLPEFKAESEGQQAKCCCPRIPEGSEDRPFSTVKKRKDFGIFLRFSSLFYFLLFFFLGGCWFVSHVMRTDLEAPEKKLLKIIF
jgi:hypothetical protein